MEITVLILAAFITSSISAVLGMGGGIILLGIMAIMSPILFFIITNFSVWLLYDYYPKTFEGLLLCYTMGLPFFKNTMLSTLIYTGLFVVFIDFLKNTPFGLKLQKI